MTEEQPKIVEPLTDDQIIELVSMGINSAPYIGYLIAGLPTDKLYDMKYVSELPYADWKKYSDAKQKYNGKLNRLAKRGFLVKSHRDLKSGTTIYEVA